MEFLLEKMKQHKKQNLPFVLYRKPNSKTIVGVFQQNDHVYYAEDLSQKGFVFTNFSNDKSIIFPLEISETAFGTFKQNEEKNYLVKETLYKPEEKNKFTQLVSKGIENIKKGLLEKIVLSRTETLLIKDFKAKKAYKKLLQQYPTAFCYYWSHPKIGSWMGATPEKLLYSQNNQFKTMSLAGTQKYQENQTVNWTNKEIVEQEIVTNFIVENLKKITPDVIVSDVYTTRAGNLLHLKTDINGILDKNVSLKKIINILHPTPAVCGLPKDTSKKFIEQNEGYDREFYTGFLGELNYDFNKNEESVDLYVNLRCMKINQIADSSKSNITLYIGCGITKDSNPEAEWEETINKSKTIKQIL
jgi:isochorismate synthase